MLPVDPLLSANLYAAGHLDRALTDFLAPLRHEILAPQELLWWIRNRRGGSHLKLRLHAPDGRRGALRKAFEDRAADFFAALPGEAAARTGLSGAGGPTIDAEDEVSHDHPDRTLLWTSYRRSAVTFGDPALLPEERYLERFASALGAGCHQILELLELGEDGKVDFAQRQQILLRLLLTGLGALPFSAAERRFYQRYHRDWLIRFTLLKGGAEGEVKAPEVLDHFNARLATMAPTVEHLRSFAAAAWGSAEGDAEHPPGSWEGALAELWRDLLELCSAPAFAELDSYTDQPAHLPLFKVVHGSANALGLGLLEEAFAHHLLLAASETSMDDSPSSVARSPKGS